MELINRIFGVIHVVYGVAIAIAFVLWTTAFPDDLWWIVNILSLIVLLASLGFNFARKTAATAASGDSVTREYLESNVLFYGTIIVLLLFLYNWISILVDGAIGFNEVPVRDAIWVVIDIGLAIISTTTGMNLLRRQSND